MEAKMRKLFCMAAALLLAAPPLAAAQSDAPPSARVSYADLDLTGAAGRAALDRRVRGAVAQLCRVEDGAPLARRMEARGCARETLARGQAMTAVAIARAQGQDGSVRLAAR